MAIGTATPARLTTRITRASAGARPCSGGTTGAGEVTSVGIIVTVTCCRCGLCGDPYNGRREHEHGGYKYFHM